MMRRFQQNPPLSERAADFVQYRFGKSMNPRWRELANMALDYFTIPAMGAEPERVFSGATITLSDGHSRMVDNAVKALDLKRWQRDGLIAASRVDVKATEDIFHALCQDLEE